MNNVYPTVKELSKGAYSRCSLIVTGDSNYSVLKESIDDDMFEGTKYHELKELHCLMKLRKHPNIINLKNVVFDKNHKIKFILDYVPMTLGDFIKRTDFQTRKRFFLPFVQQMLSAIEFMHKNNIIHTDLKSSNILVSYDPKSPYDINSFKSYIIDFGSAVDTNFNEKYTIVTTIRNRAPEVYKYDNRYDSKIDIWSFGMVLMNFLYGKPFISKEESQSSPNILGKIQLVEKFVDHVFSDENIKELLHPMLQLNRHDRFDIHQTITKFSDTFKVNVPIYDIDSDDQILFTITQDASDKLFNVIKDFSEYIQEYLPYVNITSKSITNIFRMIEKLIIKMKSSGIEHKITSEIIAIAWFLNYQFSHKDVDYMLSDILPFINLFFDLKLSTSAMSKKIVDYLKMLDYKFI